MHPSLKSFFHKNIHYINTIDIILQDEDHEDHEDHEADSSWTDEYDNEPNYQGPVYHSQPCFCKRGVSYTPPGYVRRRVKRRKVMKEDTPPQHSDNTDVDDVVLLLRLAMEVAKG